MSKNIYVANQTQQDIYVLAAKSSGWVIGDLLTDIALFAVGIGEIRAGLSVAELPATINTMRDLITVMKTIAALLSGTVAAGSRSAEAIKEVVDAFKKNSLKIAPGDYKDVRDTGLLDYLSPSGIAGLLDADTIILLVMTDEGKKITDFPTNIDYSWIVNSFDIVRSKYGTIHEEDPDAGRHLWSNDRLLGRADQYLEKDDQLVSTDKMFKLVYQSDGNLVLYRTSDNAPLWATNTAGKNAWRVYMQPDGNFVVYEAYRKPVWASNTDGNTDSFIVIQRDGNLVIYNQSEQPIWVSNTANK
jgi:hypothetical protein